MGLDVFIESAASAEALATSLEAPSPAARSGWAPSRTGGRRCGRQRAGGFSPSIISARGFCWKPPIDGDGAAAIADLLSRLDGQRWMHLEKLQRFDGTDSYAKGQGES